MKPYDLIKKIIQEELEIYKKGLYQAKKGDYIQIGAAGRRWKEHTQVKKILPNGKIVDTEGNIFNPNGQLYRGATHNTFKKFNQSVSAKLITQKEFDQQYKSIKVDFLRKFDWGKLDIKELESIINQLPILQANKLNISRFK